LVVLIPDQPKGYIQRVGLGVLGFALFGAGSASRLHGERLNYRPILLLIIFAVELNDIFAYICGHLFGTKIFPTPVEQNGRRRARSNRADYATLCGWRPFCLVGYALDHARLLAGLGIIGSVVGQFGDSCFSLDQNVTSASDTGKTHSRAWRHSRSIQ